MVWRTQWYLVMVWSKWWCMFMMWFTCGEHSGAERHDVLSTQQRSVMVW
jgi:hypothetical protein